MLLSNEIASVHTSYEATTAPAAEAGFATAAKCQFVTFFQNKGFSCAADAMQQLKATYNKLTVRFSVSDPKIASDQGHAICYLSFAPANKRYKIAVTNANSSTYTYTLLEDNFVRTAKARQQTSTFSSLEELLNTIFPKASSIAGVRVLYTFFIFLFF